jgi:hypothetical protein
MEFIIFLKLSWCVEDRKKKENGWRNDTRQSGREERFLFRFFPLFACFRQNGFELDVGGGGEGSLTTPGWLIWRVNKRCHKKRVAQRSTTAPKQLECFRIFWCLFGFPIPKRPLTLFSSEVDLKNPNQEEEEEDGRVCVCDTHVGFWYGNESKMSQTRQPFSFLSTSLSSALVLLPENAVLFLFFYFFIFTIPSPYWSSRRGIVYCYYY